MNYTHTPGSRPLPRYTIQRGIGVGGFGEVYFALSDAGKEVALKAIQRNLDVELRGASHCLNLKHPNLVALHDICRVDEGQPWVVMEYVEGPNLRDLLKQSPTGLPLREVKRWMVGVLQGVGHLHDSGVVHRDLKPENIFDDNGVIKVGDYGLSKLMAESTARHTEGVGTVHYMAPEIGRGEYGPCVDIYAIGILLHELLTGEVPFDGETRNEVMIKHLTAEPCLDKLSGTMRETILRCLKKDPKERFQSIEQLSRSFLEALAYEDGDGIQVAELVVAEESVMVAEVVEERSPRMQPDEVNSTHLDQKSLGGWSSFFFSVLKNAPIALLVIGGITLFMLKGFEPHAEVYNGDQLSDLSEKLLTPWEFMIPFVIVVACILIERLDNVFGSLRREQVVKLRVQEDKARKTAVSSVRYQVGSRKWRLAARNYLATRGSDIRRFEWLKSSMVSIPVALILSIVFLSLTNPNGAFDAIMIAPFVWIFSLIVISALSLTALSTLLQSREDEDYSGAVVFVSLGVFLGAVAFLVHRYLLLEVDFKINRDVDATSLPMMFYPQNAPSIWAFVSHFATLFLIVRWVKCIDPIRRHKLRIWYVLVAVISEWVVQQFLPIAQPSGMFFAAGLSITLQLSSPWIPNSERSRLLLTQEASGSEAVLQ